MMHLHLCRFPGQAKCWFRLAGAAQFKKEYEKAVLHNEKILGLSESSGEAPTKITKADDDADELAEGVAKVDVAGKTADVEAPAAKSA